MIRVASLWWRVTRTCQCHGQWHQQLLCKTGENQCLLVQMVFLFDFWSTMYVSCAEDIVLAVPQERSVWTVRKALELCVHWPDLMGGRAHLLWICGVSHPPQEWRKSCVTAVCWGSKSRNNVLGTSELFVSSKLRTNLFLLLVLSGATESSWRPTTSSVPCGQCWGQYPLTSSLGTWRMEQMCSAGLQKHRTGRSKSL